jgi:hypothetical protein
MVGIGFVLAGRPARVMRTVSTLALIAYQSALTAQVVQGGLDVGRLVFPGSVASTNLSTAVLIGLQLLHCMSVFRLTGQAPVVLPALSMLLSLPARGRSGVALLTAIFVLSVIQRLSSQKRLAARLVLMVAAVLLVASYWTNIAGIAFATRLRYGLEDQSRLVMLYQYSSSLTLWDVFAGGTYGQSPSILRFDGNPHNSFINAHYLFGLPYLLLLGGIVGLALFQSARWPTRRWYEGALLSFYVVRAAVDTIAFPTILDFVFFYLVFSILGTREPTSEPGRARAPVGASVQTAPG